MDIEGVGFVIGLIGAIFLKMSMDLMRRSRNRPLQPRTGKEPDDPAQKVFLRGIALVLLGLAIETYARLFLR